MLTFNLPESMVEFYSDFQSVLEHHDLRDSVKFIKYWFLDSWKELVAQDHWQSVFGDLERTLNRRPRHDGEIKLTIPYACIDCRKS